MSLQTIESQDLTLGKLFDDFYVVPSYQREYVWEEKHVDQLLQDINTEYQESGDTTSEYFIGSIVVLKRPDGVYELIDGQQRMTTTFLTLCAIRDHLREIEPSFKLGPLENQIASATINENGEEVFRYRVSLQYEDSTGVLEAIAQHENHIDEIRARTRSTENILRAYQVARSFLKSEFGADRAAVQKFYAYCTLRVKLIRVETVSIAHALKVFETINDRGAGLDSMDLLKNLMFIQASPSQFELLKNRWKDLVDTLHASKEKPLRFLRYFIFSRYDVDRLKEEEIYGWFSDHAEECGYKDHPIQFVDELLRAAKAFVRFTEGKDVTGTPNRYLENISHLSGAARQHLILLMAAQDSPAEVFTPLCRELENLFFAYIISREPTRAFEQRFALWARNLRHVHDAEGLESFISKYIDPAKEALAPRYTLAFQELREDTIQKYRMRYVLAKLTQYVDEIAYGSSGPQRNLETYLNAQVEVEHVLPQTPPAGMTEEFGGVDAYREYLHRLGNLTLLEKPINSSIGNQEFAVKKKAYADSNYLLTRSLGKKIQVGTNTAIDRAGKKLDTFEEWDQEAIERRQAMLTRLAHETWDMPAATPEELELVAAL